MTTDIENQNFTITEETLEPQTTEVITVNFAEGKIVSTVHYDSEGGIPKFFRELAKHSKKNNIKSVIVLTIDDEDHVDWVHVAKNEHHLALAALCLDDMKEDLRDTIFGTAEA